MCYRTGQYYLYGGEASQPEAFTGRGSEGVQAGHGALVDQRDQNKHMVKQRSEALPDNDYCV